VRRCSSYPPQQGCWAPGPVSMEGRKVASRPCWRAISCFISKTYDRRPSWPLGFSKWPGGQLALPRRDAYNVAVRVLFMKKPREKATKPSPPKGHFRWRCGGQESELQTRCSPWKGFQGRSPCVARRPFCKTGRPYRQMTCVSNPSWPLGLKSGQEDPDSPPASGRGWGGEVGRSYSFGII
jgi:hypothetical protein